MVTPARFANRNKFYKRLVEAGPGRTASSEQRDSIIRSMDNAHRLLSSPAGKAFDVALPDSLVASAETPRDLLRAVRSAGKAPGAAEAAGADERRQGGGADGEDAGGAHPGHDRRRRQRQADAHQVQVYGAIVGGLWERR